MLSQKEIKEKLFRQGEVFDHNYHEKKWSQAKYAYDIAVEVAVFCEMDEPDLIRMFGSKSYNDTDPPTSGIFNEEYVSRAYLECIKSNETFEKKKCPDIPGQKNRT